MTNEETLENRGIEKESAAMPAIHKTERLPCKEQRRHRFAVDGERPSDLSNADGGSTGVTRNRLHGMCTVNVMQCVIK